MPEGHCEHGKRRRDCMQCMPAAACEHGKRQRDCGECCQHPCAHGNVPRRCKRCTKSKEQNPRGAHRGQVAAGFMWSADLGFAVATMDSMAMGNRASACALAVATMPAPLPLPAPPVPAPPPSAPPPPPSLPPPLAPPSVASPVEQPAQPTPSTPSPPPPPSVSMALTVVQPAPPTPTLVPPPATVELPAVVACPAVSLPAIVCLVNRPGPQLPTQTADGLPLPRDCFNPYDEAAPAGTWQRIAKHVPKCAYALLGLPQDTAPPLLMIEAHTIRAPVDLDTLMQEGGYSGFCIHTARDVLLCGLNPELSAQTFTTTAQMRSASFVVDEVHSMVPLIRQSAKDLGGTHTIYDDYTTRFGYRYRWEASPSPSPAHSPHLHPALSPSLLTLTPHPHPHPSPSPSPLTPHPSTPQHKPALGTWYSSNG